MLNVFIPFEMMIMMDSLVFNVIRIMDFNYLFITLNRKFVKDWKAIYIDFKGTTNKIVYL